MIAHPLSRSSIEWISMRHEEAGAFDAHGEPSLTSALTAVAGSCGLGSLHFINGIAEANRNRAAVHFDRQLDCSRRIGIASGWERRSRQMIGRLSLNSQ
jgi:hypothetical protein